MDVDKKSALCGISIVAAIGVQYNPKKFAPDLDQVLYDISRHFFALFLENDSLDAIKFCVMLTMFNIMGKVSAVLPMTDGSMFLYVRGKLPVDPAKMQADLPAFTEMVRRGRMEEAFNDWFRREVQKGLTETPVLRRPPPELGSGGKS